MQTVGLTWQHSVEVAAVLTVGGGGLALSDSRVLRAAGAFARETAMIGLLYALWELVGRISVTGTKGAYQRAVDRASRPQPAFAV